ncbi:homeodomain-interacting protein kinase 3-like [Paralichthys olivaceus]|uniref:homeodomain-interacting protein kinase 3-like n=1 Tax=Paralichthys olivaceus TaxID=8255 RepID=UPI00375164E4
MSSCESSEASSAASVALTAPEIQAGEVLHSSSSSYSVLDFIGEGSFGKIALSVNLRTNEKVAVKILKDTEFDQDTEQEVAILNLISGLDADCTHMVRFYEEFQHMDHMCLVFERLDRSLHDLLEQREWEPLPLCVIRPVAMQLFVALDFLKGLGVLHTDIKPDNVMFVNMQDQPLKIKLIDFGCAMMVSDVEVGMDVQPYGYRAPEISLGLPFTEAVDVWGVGCVLAFLYLAQNLFPIHCEYQMMSCMVAVLGQPQDHLLRAGKYSQRFFTEEEGEAASSWRLMTAEEYKAANKVETEQQRSFIELPSSLSGLIHIHPKLEAAEMDDRVEFASLLEGLLHLDGDERISPCQALQKPFISMSHLREDVDSRDYLTTSQILMRVCPTEDGVHSATSDVVHSATSDVVHSATSDVVHSATSDVVHSVTSDCGYAGSMDTLSVSSIGDDDSNEASWSCDLTIVSTDTTWSSLFNETVEVSWSSDEAVDATAAATASTGGMRKLLRRIGKFFSSLTSCCRPKVED